METYRNIHTTNDKREIGKLDKQKQTATNKVLDIILQRILKVPTTTPQEECHTETGLLGVEHYIEKTP